MKLPNIDQSWFDDNRTRFNAQTYSSNLPKNNPHKHTFYRKSPVDIACRTCNNGWRDMGVFKEVDTTSHS